MLCKNVQRNNNSISNICDFFGALGIATVVPILQIADAARHFPVPDCNAIGTPRFDDVDCNAHGPRH